MSNTTRYFVHEGRYAAEFDIITRDDVSPWGPMADKSDVFKADRIRLALRNGDVAAAAREAKVYELMPLAGE